MLIGCGCNCADPVRSEFPSGSFRSIDSNASLLPSESFDPGEGYCGACYNAPAEWVVQAGSNWLIYNRPDLFYDCRHNFYGDFVLRPYGIAAATYMARVLTFPAGGYPETVCNVWQSDERAPYVNRETPTGEPQISICEATEFPRWELLMHTPLGSPSTNVEVHFTLWYWWVQNVMFGQRSQAGFGYAWRVPAQWNGGPVFQNCVRCFGADPFDVSWQLTVAYENSRPDSIAVCPN